MTKRIKSFMLVIIFFLINAYGASNLHSFEENIHSNDEWKLKGNIRMTNTFSVEFNTKKFYKKIGGELSNSYDLSKGNELDISFKPEIENNSELGLEKKNENKYFDIVLSKKHIENLVEINDELSDSIFLRFTLIEQDPNVFEFSVVRNSNGQTNVSHSFENFQTGNIFNIRIYKNNLIFYFSGKNVSTMDIKELVGQEKIYITLKTSLSEKLVLKEFKVKTLLKIPKKFQKIKRNKR